VTALALALAFTSALAFAGFVLWLRERRGHTVVARLKAFDMRVEAVESITHNLPELRATVESLALKAGLRPRS
jgi:hypothetical protein